MLYNGRTEGIEFLHKGFKFQQYVYNRCHDILMSVKLNGIVILSINSADYFFIVN